MTMHNQFNYLQADEIGKLAQITPEELCDDCGEVNQSWSYNKPTGEAAQLCSGCYDEIVNTEGMTEGERELSFDNL